MCCNCRQRVLRRGTRGTGLACPSSIRGYKLTARQSVLGSDEPFPLGDVDPVRRVRDAQLGAEATPATLSDNAQALFRLGSGTYSQRNGESQL